MTTPAVMPLLSYGGVSLPPNTITITGSGFHTGTFSLNFTPNDFAFDGQDLTSIESRSSNGNLSITFQGTLTQNFFTEVTFSNDIFGQLTYTTASADTFTTVGGNSIWTWDGQDFNADNVGGTATFS